MTNFIFILKIFEIEKNEDSSYEEVDSLDMTNRWNIFWHSSWIFICDSISLERNLACICVCICVWISICVCICVCICVLYLQVRCHWSGLPHDPACWIPPPHLPPEVGGRKLCDIIHDSCHRYFHSVFAHICTIQDFFEINDDICKIGFLHMVCV